MSVVLHWPRLMPGRVYAWDKCNPNIRHGAGHDHGTEKGGGFGYGVGHKGSGGTRKTAHGYGPWEDANGGKQK